jgi:uncharacterized protein YjbI with pentapeptide repeats
MNNTNQELRDRWTEDSLAVTKKVFASMDPALSIKFGGVPKNESVASPFGMHDGRHDFRGLPLNSSPRYRRYERCDFSFCEDTSPGQFSTCTMIDCLFDGASITRNVGRLFDRCSFHRARMARASLIGAFNDCDFRGADLRSGAGSDLLEFTRCDFSNARFDLSVFSHTRFESCNWEGATFKDAGLAYCQFVGSCPTPAQLEPALTGNAKFEGCGAKEAP